MPPKARQLWILAGGNGAGKSTFYRQRLQSKGVQFINADLIEKQLKLPPEPTSSYKAAQLAQLRIRELFDEGASFCFETVFSHHSKLDLITEAQQRGYQVTLVFIHLSDTRLNELRVAQRVTEGGHAVPVEKIATRIERLHHLMIKAVAQSDHAYLLDNSSAQNPFRQIAAKHGTTVEVFEDPMPLWAAQILSM